MTDFKSFGIKRTSKNFIGDKIKMKNILNKPIKVHAYREGPSKFTDKGSGICTDLQIELDGKMHIVFTGSKYLLEMIRDVPKEGFPFDTTIVEHEDESLEFT